VDPVDVRRGFGTRVVDAILMLFPTRAMPGDLMLLLMVKFPVFTNVPVAVSESGVGMLVAVSAPLVVMFSPLMAMTEAFMGPVVIFSVAVRLSLSEAVSVPLVVVMLFPNRVMVGAVMELLMDNIPVAAIVTTDPLMA